MTWFEKMCAAMSVTLLCMAQPLCAQTPPVEFASGVLTTIPPDPQNEEMFSGPLPLVELPIAIEGLEYDPKLSPKSQTVFERAKGVTLRRTIWNLEFSFKPLRMIYVDIPQPTGRMQRKLVWYMVYRVRNLGGHIKPQEVVETVEKSAGAEKHITFDRELTDEVEVFGRTTTDLRFFPHFVLASSEYKKEYLDRVIPAAIEPILQREFLGRDVKLHDSLSISEVPIPISNESTDNSVWGVATWVDVDPRIDYYMVYVQGLTNAYRFDDPAGAFQKGDQPGSGRKLMKKTLQLNFWRPGDTIDPHEEEIRYGARIDSDPVEQQKIFALFGIDKPIDHRWLYR
ncbi:MAG: hypothetical protein WD872_14255 [Pirellulaceae bacterium]